MNEDVKRVLIQELTVIVRSVKVERSFLLGRNIAKGVSRDGVDFTFDRETLNKFEEIIRRLLTNCGWSQKFSEKYLEDKLLEIIATTLVAGDYQNAGEKFALLVTSYESFAEEHITLLPLGGFVLEADSLCIGKIILHKVAKAELTDGQTDSEANSVSKSLISRLTPVQKKLLLRGTAERFVCAEHRTVAEPKRAEERAEEECNRVLELLRYATPSLYDDSLKIELGYAWEVAARHGSSLTFRESGQGFSSSSKGAGAVLAFELNAKNIKELERIGVFKVAKILEKSPVSLSQFESILLRSIHWFGTSVLQRDVENKFLNLLICVETLLNPRSGDSIANAVAEGMAFVIATKFEDRVWVKKRVKELYKIRSGLSHGGKKEILDADLHHLKELAGRLLMWAISKADDFQTHQALLDWIEEQKLT